MTKRIKNGLILLLVDKKELMHFKSYYRFKYNK